MKTVFSSCVHLSKNHFICGIWTFSQETMFPFHNVTEQEECQLSFRYRFFVLHSDFHISIVLWVWESSCVLMEWLIFPPRHIFLWIPGASDWCERPVGIDLVPGSIIWLQRDHLKLFHELNWKRQFNYSNNSCSKTFNVYKWLLRTATWYHKWK